jgi:hypothetical protein
MLVDSYLNGRTQSVRCDEKEPSVRRVTCGVPQGSVLGPLLFISYINDISKVIKYSRYHIYTDDLQIYHSSSVSYLQRCYDEINMDLQQIHELATANGLKMNPEKSQVILIHRCRADILRVGSLGFVLNERLTATDHFRKLCQRIYWILRSLRPHAKEISFVAYFAACQCQLW